MRRIFFLILILSQFACAHKFESADLVIHNAIIYTLNEENDVVDAMAIKDGKIIDCGPERKILNKYNATDYLDAKGRPVYPGFFDAHCHILNYGLTFLEVKLNDSESWEECVQKTKDFTAKHKSSWIKGRGWDQNLWKQKEFPDNTLLNQIFPDKPVFLVRIDGHAAIANNKALEIAGIDINTVVSGGTIVKNNGALTGVLIDNAMDLVKAKIPAPTNDEIEKALSFVNTNTISYGLTTLCDAGSEIETFKQIESLQQKNKFLPKVYGMLIPENNEIEFAKKNGQYHKNKIWIQAFKIVADGALGSRGACLKHEYSDLSGVYGKMLFPVNKIDSLVGLIYDLKYQINTHCIGDSANATLLKIYAKYLEKTNDLRWRIEHAQILDLNELNYFSQYSIIPSVQPTHAVSDMPWAKHRVGDERMKGAYAYKMLMQQNGMIAFGTDFPIEEINPFKTFYAAVARKYYNGKPIKGLNQSQCIDRIDALKAMTKWAALACFMENTTGSIEIGKDADVIVLSNDILKIPESEILNTMVIHTIINGKRVHSLE